MQVPRTAQEADAPAELLNAQATSLEQLRRFAEAGFLYAVLDSTDRPKVPQKALELGERAASLFRGSPDESNWAVAPYLVEVDSAVLDWIVEHLWQEPWGVFIMSKADMELLRNHLRRFLMVQLPDGERWFFRFYDPRILKAYLPSCSRWELEKFYGPVRAFTMQDPDRSGLWIIQRTQAAKFADPNAVDTDPTATLWWTIRSEQMAALSQTAQTTLCDRMVARLSQAYPEYLQQVSFSDFHHAVTLWIQEAAKWEITSDPELEHYLRLCVCHEEMRDPSRYPSLLEALSWPGRSPGEKVVHLLELFSGTQR